MDEELGSQKLRKCHISIYSLDSAAQASLICALIFLVTVTGNVSEVSRIQSPECVDIVSDKAWPIPMVLLIVRTVHQ